MGRPWPRPPLLPDLELGLHRGGCSPDPGWIWWLPLPPGRIEGEVPVVAVVPVCLRLLQCLFPLDWSVCAWRLDAGAAAPGGGSRDAEAGVVALVLSGGHGREGGVISGEWQRWMWSGSHLGSRLHSGLETGFMSG